MWSAEGWVDGQAKLRSDLMEIQGLALEGLPQRFRQADWDYSMVKKQHPVSDVCFFVASWPMCCGRGGGGGRARGWEGG